MRLNSEERKIWWTSDIHHYHKNICYGESSWPDRENDCRKFDTTKEMSRHMIEQINKYVGQDDLLFFGGDWSFGGIENVWNLRKQLIVRDIIFIEGNHDQHITKNRVLPNCHYDKVSDIIVDGPNPNTYGDERDAMFDVRAKELFTEVHKYLELTIDGRTVMVFHRPIEDFHDQRGRVIHLHGHTHGKLPKKERRLDFGIDNAFLLFGEYRPFSWEDVLKYA